MNIILRVASKTWFTDPDISRLPRPAQINAMQYGVAVTHAITERQTRHWMGEQVHTLWRYLNKPEHTVIGFNQEGFDVPILRNAMEESGEQRFRTFDIFNIIKAATGRWYHLAALNISNLDRRFTGNGALTTQLLRAKKPLGAIQELEKDVGVIKGLYEILAAEKPLLLPPLPNRDEFESLYFWAFPNVRHIVADPSKPALTLDPDTPRQ